MSAKLPRCKNGTRRVGKDCVSINKTAIKPSKNTFDGNKTVPDFAPKREKCKNGTRRVGKDCIPKREKIFTPPPSPKQKTPSPMQMAIGSIYKKLDNLMVEYAKSTEPAHTCGVDHAIRKIINFRGGAPMSLQEALKIFNIQKKDINAENIKKISRKLLLKNHPDRHITEKEKYTKITQNILEAQSVLNNYLIPDVDDMSDINDDMRDMMRKYHEQYDELNENYCEYIRDWWTKFHELLSAYPEDVVRLCKNLRTTPPTYVYSDLFKWYLLIDRNFPKNVKDMKVSDLTNFLTYVFIKEKSEFKSSMDNYLQRMRKHLKLQTSNGK